MSGVSSFVAIYYLPKCIIIFVNSNRLSFAFLFFFFLLSYTSDKGGSIWFGIHGRRVTGIEVDHDARDEFRLGVDHCLSNMIPPVQPGSYRVIFNPVRKNSMKAEHIPDCYVIGEYSETCLERPLP